MKKFLRFAAVAAMLAATTAAFGQKVSFDFSTNTGSFPEGSSAGVTEGTYTVNGYTFTVEATTSFYYNTQGYLMLGKKDSKLILPKFDFAVSKIEFVGRDGASGSTLCNLYVGDVAVSTQTTGCKVTNTYEIATEYQAAGNQYAYVVESAHNAQIVGINVYEATGDEKKSAGLSWSETKVVVEKGGEFTAPTLTKATTATVTFASDNEAVATVNADGVISLAGELGTAIVTATAAENDEYKAGEASVTIVVVSYNTYKKVTAVTAGKKYLIVAQRDGNTYYAYPISATYSYGYLSVGTANGIVDELQVSTEYDDAFTISAYDDGYAIQDYLGRYYYADGSHASFQVATEAPDNAWSIKANADGTFDMTFGTSNGDYTIYWGQGTYTTFGMYTSQPDGTVKPMLFEDATSGIDAISVDNTVDPNAPVVYYNLQGARVNNPATGIYIRVQGNNASKVYVK